MSTYSYTRKFFDPKDDAPVGFDIGMRGGDHPVEPTERPYVYGEEIILAVNIAMAANRPLLVAGLAGSGKSSLAANIARQMKHSHGEQGWDYRQKVITARTEARDLLWRFDAIKRLRDAHATDGAAKLDGTYVHRGVLWEAFEASAAGQRMVVLVDEIDKADPDLPNSLLETLGTGSFPVDDVPGKDVTADPEHPPFIVITTNNERELSRPFIRRCVTLTLPSPKGELLKQIAERWGLTEKDPRGVVAALADELDRAAAASRGADEPSVAEYLDAVRTCLHLDIGPEHPRWKADRKSVV